MQRYIVLIVLVFSFICAKQILILNEEIVVALTFIGFVLYIETSFGNTIRESLQSRGVAILEELQHHMILQEMNIQSAIREQKFIADEFQKATKQIGDFISHEMSEANEVGGEPTKWGANEMGGDSPTIAPASGGRQPHHSPTNLPKLQQSLHFALGQQIGKQLTSLVNSQTNSRNALQPKFVTGLKKLAQIQYSYSKGRKAQRIQFKQCFAVLQAKKK
jgi:hypothetical protein